LGFSFVGTDDEEFSVEMHHGGCFVAQGSNKAYVNGRVSWFDHVEVAKWSPLFIEQLVFKLHYPKNPKMKVFWLLPGKDLSNGLRLIWTDTNTMVMSSLVHKLKNFVLYLDHDDNLSDLQWNDIVANDMNSPPKVFSPMNTMHMDNADSGRVPEFCGYDRVDARNDGSFGDDRYDDSAGDDIEEDPNFVDSDYELAADDDDLFQYVDDEEGRKKKDKGNKALSVVSNVEDDMSIDEDDDELQLPESDDEGGESLRFQTFRELDMHNPILSWVSYLQPLRF
jgi:hypothetical protein